MHRKPGMPVLLHIVQSPHDAFSSLHQCSCQRFAIRSSCIPRWSHGVGPPIYPPMYRQRPTRSWHSSTLSDSRTEGQFRRWMTLRSRAIRARKPCRHSHRQKSAPSDLAIPVESARVDVSRKQNRSDASCVPFTTANARSTTFPLRGGREPDPSMTPVPASKMGATTRRGQLCIAMPLQQSEVADRRSITGALGRRPREPKPMKIARYSAAQYCPALDPSLIVPSACIERHISSTLAPALYTRNGCWT